MAAVPVKIPTRPETHSSRKKRQRSELYLPYASPSSLLPFCRMAIGRPVASRSTLPPIMRHRRIGASSRRLTPRATHNDSDTTSYTEIGGSPALVACMHGWSDCCVSAVCVGPCRAYSVLLPKAAFGNSATQRRAACYRGRWAVR